MAKKVDRIIVEIKKVKTLQPRHVTETIKKYQYPYFPGRYDIIIPRNTHVLPETRALIKQKNAKIRRMRGFQ